MEDFQPSKMSNGLKAYLSKSSQKNDPSNFKEQRIKPLGIAQILLSLLGMCIMLLRPHIVLRTYIFLLPLCLLLQ